MKKALLLIVSLILILTACGTDTTQNDEPINSEKPTNPPAEEKAEQTIEGYETITLEEQKDWVNITVSYPKFNVEPLDKEIERAATRKFEEYLAINEEPDELALEYDMLYAYDLNFADPIITDTFVSIEFTEYTYTGGAHGNYISIPFNYNYKKNRFIKIQDVLRGDREKLEKLAQITYNELSQWEGLFMDAVVEETAPLWDNFSTFLLTEDSIIILFQPYEVGPYAAGLIDVEIPLEELR